MIRWLFALLPVLFSNLGHADSIRSFAVFKLYQSETGIKGGISGTAFFIDEKTAVTAHHVISKERKWMWLLNKEFGSISMQQVQFRFEPERDLTYIEFASPVVDTPYVFSNRLQIDATLPVYSEGYKVGSGKVKVNYVDEKFQIQEILDLPHYRMSGHITWIENVTVDSDDLKLNQVDAIRMTLPLWVGMSGGPLLQNNQVIGFNSFGLPADAPQKSESWAIPLNGL